MPDVEIAYVCDVDQTRMAEGVNVANAGQSAKAKGVTDFARSRRSLGRHSIHRGPKFLACSRIILAADRQARLRRKPGYDPQEAEWVVEAARKHDRRSSSEPNAEATNR